MKKRLSKAGIAVCMGALVMANTAVYGQEDDTIQVSVSDATVEQGETVKVAVNLDANPGIYGILLEISYDEEHLTLLGYEDAAVGNMFTSDGSVTESEELNEVPYVLLYEDFTGPEGETATGTLGYLEFDTAADFAGDLPVEITVTEARDYELNELTDVKATAGTITVLKIEDQTPEDDDSNMSGNDASNPTDTTDPADTNPTDSTESGVDDDTNTTPNDDRLPGDVNDDGVVDAKDVIFIKRYNAGWSVAINEANADVNGDALIDAKDMIIIRRYVVGWNVELK